MNRSSLKITEMAVAALAMVFAAGCSGGGYPVEMDITMAVGSGYSIDDYGANPGDVLTPDMDIPSVPLCTLPGLDDIDEMVRDSVGGFVAGLLEVDRLELIEITIEATEGDFSSVTGLSMEYVPKSILGIEQPGVELGETSSESGLGTVIRLEPPETVDFLDLIEDNDSNPTPGCPQLDAQLSGTVPAETPAWNVSVKLHVVGHVSI